MNCIRNRRPDSGRQFLISLRAFAIDQNALYNVRWICVSSVRTRTSGGSYDAAKAYHRKGKFYDEINRYRLTQFLGPSQRGFFIVHLGLGATSSYNLLFVATVIQIVWKAMTDASRESGRALESAQTSRV